MVQRFRGLSKVLDAPKAVRPTARACRRIETTARMSKRPVFLLLPGARVLKIGSSHRKLLVRREDEVFRRHKGQRAGDDDPIILAMSPRTRARDCRERSNPYNESAASGGASPTQRNP